MKPLGRTTNAPTANERDGRMKKFLGALIVLGIVAGAVAWFMSAPVRLDPARLAGITGEAARGEAVFWAGGCASCHAAPGAEGDDRLVLAGGYRMESPFGTFIAPNISTDPVHGIGGWSLEAFADAMQAGVAPDGSHYYPSFPYTAYAKMTVQDVADLKAFLDTLPASDVPSAPHQMGFPFTIRRGIGLWKRLYLNDDWVAAAPSETLERGRYLVEALSHCAECHTPRDSRGGLDVARWMGGAPDPSGKGVIPNITPAKLGWDAGEIAYYLETGFTPDYDSAGGSMTSVVKNMGQLSDEDRQAIAAYVKGLAPVE